MKPIDSCARWLVVLLAIGSATCGGGSYGGAGGGRGAASPSASASPAEIYESFTNELDVGRKRGAIRALEVIAEGDPFGEADLANMMWSELTHPRHADARKRWAPRVFSLYEASCGKGVGTACHWHAERLLESAGRAGPKVDPAQVLAVLERGCKARYPSSDACSRAALAYVGEANVSDSLGQVIELARDEQRFVELAHRGCVAGIGDTPNNSCWALVAAFQTGRFGVQPNPELAARYQQMQAAADQRSTEFWAAREAQVSQWHDAYDERQRAEQRRDQARIDAILGAIAQAGRAFTPPTLAAPPPVAPPPVSPPPVMSPPPRESSAVGAPAVAVGSSEQCLGQDADCVYSPSGTSCCAPMACMCAHGLCRCKLGPNASGGDGPSAGPTSSGPSAPSKPPAVEISATASAFGDTGDACCKTLMATGFYRDGALSGVCNGMKGYVVKGSAKWAGGAYCQPRASTGTGWKFTCSALAEGQCQPVK